MDYQKFVDALFDLGQKEGFDDMEVYFQNNKEFETTVFKNEVDKFSISEVAGLSFRGLYNHKMGYAYTEILDDASIVMLVKEAKENAKAIESDDVVVISKAQTGFVDVDAFDAGLNGVSKAEKIDFLKKVEKEVMSLDSRIQSLAYNLYTDMESELRITNTRGVNLYQKSNLAVAFVVALAVENGENKTGLHMVLDRDFKNFDYKSVAKKVVFEATSLLGSKPVKSKSYPTVFKNGCAASLLGAFASVFNAEMVQKDLSLMKGFLNKTVAGSCVTLVDDPFMKNGFANASFDAEGSPTQKTEIIKSGDLKSYLHNVKTATKDGVTSTGNASKGSYKSSLNIAASNMYIEPGKESLDELISDMTEGMIITDLQGLHSGLNTISGDFSLAANGFLVENGKVVRPVDQITVAGNLKDLLLDIIAVGNDLEFTFPSGSTFIASPSLKVKSIAVAGE